MKSTFHLIFQYGNSMLSERNPHCYMLYVSRLTIFQNMQQYSGRHSLCLMSYLYLFNYLFHYLVVGLEERTLLK